MLKDDFIDSLFSPFDWDKHSYAFNREEKDMHPYSVQDTEKEVLIIHNILGIDRKDLTLETTVENGNYYISIVGKTTDDISNKTYSVNSRFKVDVNSLNLKEIKATTKNGLLYITIPRKTKQEIKGSKIEIL